MTSPDLQPNSLEGGRPRDIVFAHLAFIRDARLSIMTLEPSISPGTLRYRHRKAYHLWDVDARARGKAQDVLDAHLKGMTSLRKVIIDFNGFGETEPDADADDMEALSARGRAVRVTRS